MWNRLLTDAMNSAKIGDIIWSRQLDGGTFYQARSTASEVNHGYDYVGFVVRREIPTSLQTKWLSAH